MILIEAGKRNIIKHLSTENVLSRLCGAQKITHYDLITLVKKRYIVKLFQGT